MNQSPHHRALHEEHPASPSQVFAPAGSRQVVSSGAHREHASPHALPAHGSYVAPPSHALGLVVHAPLLSQEKIATAPAQLGFVLGQGRHTSPHAFPAQGSYGGGFVHPSQPKAGVPSFDASLGSGGKDPRK